MEKYSSFLGWKNQYCENHYTTKCSLQIYCDPYQITNVIFHRTRTKNFTIHMETQKTPNSQSSLEMEESTLLIVPQSYSHQDSIALAQTEIQTSGTRQRSQRQTHAPVGTLLLTKEARIHNGAKIASSVSCAGKTGHLCTKE